MATGLFLAAAALLVVAGAQKIADPLPLVRALRSTGLRVSGLTVRVIAAGEVIVAVGSLVTGNGIGVALSYLAFTAFVITARIRGGVLSSCGCFGKADTPPTWLHAAVTLGLSLASLPGRTAGLDLSLLTAAAAVAATAYLTMAVLPLVQAR